MMKFQTLIFSFLTILLFTSEISAQSFEESGAVSGGNAKDFGLLIDKKEIKAETKNKLQTTEDIAKALEKEKARILKEREDVFMPGGGADKLFMPTQDKSKRGDVAVLETDENGNTRANSNIFMYMDNFGISRSIGGMVTCNMRFVIITNLDRRLVSLDTKLVWPEMTTTLSYNNVMPNTATVYNYALMGEGCYSMDKSPNIVVNRCRVKGLSSAECANKIIWLTD